MIDFNLLFLAVRDQYVLYAESIFGEAKPQEVSQETLRSFMAGGPRFGNFEMGNRQRAATAGKELYEFIFKDQIGNLFTKGRSIADDRKTPLRIVLKFPYSDELQAIPWELLNDGDEFLCLSSRPISPIIRYTAGLISAPEDPVEGRLRILLTTASPKGMPELDVEKEVTVVSNALASEKDMVDLIIEKNVSLETLRDIWQRELQRTRPFHIWHHCGHGEYRRVGNQNFFNLILEKDEEPQLIAAKDLTALVEINPELRAAVMNVCFSGEGVGLATLLAKIHVPLTIGFKGTVDDDAALDFARSFYQGLTHVPAETALTRARQSLWNHPDLGSMAWVGPLLHSRYRTPALVREYKPEPVTVEPENSLPKPWTDPAFHIGPGKIRFVRIEPGEGIMGSDSLLPTSDTQGERPKTIIRFAKPWYMAEVPMTRGELVTLLREARASNLHIAKEIEAYEIKPGENHDLPITHVNHHMAKAVAHLMKCLDNRLNFRIPTEAEWEYAARAGDMCTFLWEQQKSALQLEAWYQQPSVKGPRPVRLGPHNDFGLYDMLGNVQEWCSTPWEYYPGGEVVNWKPVNTSNHRVLRGGSFKRPITECRFAYRSNAAREEGGPDYGLRLVFTPPTESSTFFEDE